jgi:hypothetical protein
MHLLHAGNGARAPGTAAAVLQCWHMAGKGLQRAAEHIIAVAACVIADE